MAKDAGEYPLRAAILKRPGAAGVLAERQRTPQSVTRSFREARCVGGPAHAGRLSI